MCKLCMQISFFSRSSNVRGTMGCSKTNWKVKDLGDCGIFWEHIYRETDTLAFITCIYIYKFLIASFMCECIFQLYNKIDKTKKSFFFHLTRKLSLISLILCWTVSSGFRYLRLVFSGIKRPYIPEIMNIREKEKKKVLTCLDAGEHQSSEEHDARLHLSQPVANQLHTWVL